MPARNSESLAWQAHTKTPNTLYGIGNLPGMMSCGRRQFRYYLLTIYHPEIAVRSRDSVRRTVQSLRLHPLVGPRYSSSNPQLQNLRSWPVTGFETVRIYYLLEEDTIDILRILRGKRDVKRILEREEPG